MGSDTPEMTWDKEYANRNYRKNMLAAIELDTEGPEWIPCTMYFYELVWKKYREDLADVVKSHPFLFGKDPIIPTNYDHINPRHKVGSYVDEWECEWKVVSEGFEGQVVGHPVADYNNLDAYTTRIKEKFKDGNFLMGWAIENYAAGMKGLMRGGGGGRLFDQIYFCRGFASLMSDIARNHPNLPELIQLIQDVRMNELDLVYGLVHEHPEEHFIDQVRFHTDIGTQQRLMISPRSFKKYIKPFYNALFQRCRKEGSNVYLSSDGNLREIVDDLVECGVSVHDPQESASGGIEGIKKAYQGKMCVDLDLCRQTILYLTPDQIDRKIKKAVEELNTENGGLMMYWAISDDAVPLENIKAVCNAFEKYSILKK
jgi:hypothetical protein